MPQLPTSTAEEYGAEDELKQYTQEEDEESDTSTVDVVNDIKDDLLNDSDSAKDDQLFQPPSNRFERKDGLSYGRPAAVIVGPHHSYYDQSNGYARPGAIVSQAPNGNIGSYNSSAQLRVPTGYQRDERGFTSFDHSHWPPQVSVPHYSMPYGPGVPTKNYSYRYPPGVHPSVAYYSPSHCYPGVPGRPVKEPKRPHVKKPLNAFMLFMKEQRPKIAAQNTLKESAAINQLLGKKWHELDKSEQAIYYEMARKERAEHMQRYPGWSARDNYAQLGRKKKRPRDKTEEMNPKKCRARYGLDRQEQWCKPCRRKKKCIRFIVGADGETTEVIDKDQADVNSDSDIDNGENKSNNNNNNNNNINNNNNNIKVEIGVDHSTKEILQDRVTMSSAKDEPDTLVTTNNNNNNLNILGDTSISNTSTMTQFISTKSEVSYHLQDNNSLDIKTTSLPSPMETSVAFANAISCSPPPARSDKQSIDTSVLKTISTQCS